MASAKKKDDSPPMNLANATPGYLIDELGRVRDELKPLNQLEGFLKQAILGRRKDFQNAISGEKYDGLISEQQQVRIDADAVRELFKDDPEALAKVQKVIDMTVIRTTKKTAAP